MSLRITPELQERLQAVLPLALRAANEAGLTVEDNFLTADDGYSLDTKHADALGDFLAVSIEIARQGAYGLTVEMLAARFDADFVDFVDTARDGLAVAERLLMRHAPPVDIEGEEQVSRVRHNRWERDHKDAFEQAGEKIEMWQGFLQTPHLDAVYWHSRDLYDDFVSEDMLRPFIDVLLVRWQIDGLASLDVTTDTILDARFKAIDEEPVNATS